MNLESRLGILLAAIALSPMAPAMAADYEPPIYVDQAPEYVPVEVGSGWYLRGDVGYAFSHPFKIERGFNDTTNFDKRSSQLTGGVGMGYHFNDFVRGELNFGILPNNKFSDSDPQEGGHGSNKAYSSMVNGYVDLGTFAGLTPYVGGGIGLAYNKYERSLAEDNYEVESLAKLNFAYSVGAGLSYRVSQNVSVDAGYEYFAVPGAKYVSYDSGAFNINKGIDYHQLKVGLRYDLW